MDFLSIESGAGRTSTKPSICTFAKSCEDYVVGTGCDIQESYEAKPCYKELLNQKITKNTQWLFKNQFEFPTRNPLDNTPMSPEQMDRLAEITNALCNGGIF